MAPQLAIVADDLTGAADTGACFADAGLATVIPFSGEPIPAADVVVLSTETREGDGREAERLVAAGVGRLFSDSADKAGAGPRWIYKKIDSALRGHPRDELLAAIAAAGAASAVVAPAFPAEGRTTIGGRQHVDGKPLESTRLGGSGAVSDLVALFANDRGLPVRLLDLAMVRGQPEVIAHLLDDEAAGIVIADAETDDDLAIIAQATRGSAVRILCGTAGFARALARTLPLIPAAPSPMQTARGAHPILLVAGSRHDATARQIAVLGAAGVAIVRPSQDVIDRESVAVDRLVAEVAAHLAAGRTTALTTAGLAASPLGGRSVAGRLAQVAAAPEVKRLTSGLVLTGGDVAAAVCAALDASALWLGGEISPGQPWGGLAGGTFPGVLAATKAGSFGDDDALLECIGFLTTTGGGRRQF